MLKSRIGFIFALCVLGSAFAQAPNLYNGNWTATFTTQNGKTAEMAILINEPGGNGAQHPGAVAILAMTVLMISWLSRQARTSSYWMCRALRWWLAVRIFSSP